MLISFRSILLTINQFIIHIHHFDTVYLIRHFWVPTFLYENIYYSNESLSIIELFDEAKWQKTANKIMDSYSVKHLYRNLNKKQCLKFVFIGDQKNAIE